MKTFLLKTAPLTLMLTVFSSNIIASELPKNNSLNMKHYSKISEMSCGESRIKIKTICEEKEIDLPYCPIQEVHFAKGINIKNVIYRNSFNDGNQPFIVKAECYKQDNYNYVVLRSTNFANCNICEWTDIFSSNGKYEGSTPGMYGDISVKRIRLNKQLDAMFYNIFQSGNSKTAETEDIFRTR